IAAEGNAVVIAMGDAGLPSRLLASRFGSQWTYAGSAVAPGQIPASRMLDEFRFRTVGAGTAISGVVGDNVMHSLSPVMPSVASGRGAEPGAWPPPAGSWDLLVNCTPLGGPSARSETPLPGGPFDGQLVYDLPYGDGETPLLRDARKAGCLTLDGLPMLVAQA